MRKAIAKCEFFKEQPLAFKHRQAAACLFYLLQSGYLKRDKTKNPGRRRLSLEEPVGFRFHQAPGSSAWPGSQAGPASSHPHPRSSPPPGAAGRKGVLLGWDLPACVSPSPVCPRSTWAQSPFGTNEGHLPDTPIQGVGRAWGCVPAPQVSLRLHLASTWPRVGPAFHPRLCSKRSLSESEQSARLERFLSLSKFGVRIPRTPSPG